MNTIGERFRDAAEMDMPPSRLTADEVYAAAWKRRRRRIEVCTAAAVIIGLLVAIVGLDLRSSGRDGVTEAPDPSPTAGARDPDQLPRDWPASTRDGQVVWATAGGGGRLYAVITRCGPSDCTTQLLGSDDAGATWTVRQAEFGKGYDWQVTAPAADVLYRAVTRIDPTSPITPVEELTLSRDGGRTWTDIQVTDTAVAAVPANGWLECKAEGQNACTRLTVVDPDTGRTAPLANNPDLELNSVVSLPATAGFWVVGFDRGKNRPAVAVSTDRGRTWTVHTFSEAPRDAGILAASADGVTGYAILGQYHPGTTTGTNPTPGPNTSTNWVYRTDDAGRTWQRDDRDGPLPTTIIESGRHYVAADGTHFVMTNQRPPQQWYRSGDDRRTYRTGGPTGISDRLVPPWGRSPGVVFRTQGNYVTFDDEAVYRSTDGRSFTRVPVRPPR